MHSNSTYSGADQALAELHDSYESLPATLAQASPGLTSYVERHRIGLDDLMRTGARIDPHGTKLAFFHAGGVRFLDLIAGKPWTSYGFDATAVKIIPGLSPNGDGIHRVIVVEGESDAARMSGQGPGWDTFVMVGGAHYVPQSYLDALAQYDEVIVATDADKAGDEAAAKITAGLPGKSVTRWRPPVEGSDWCDLAEIGEPPKPAAPLPAWSSLFTRASDVTMKRQRYLWEGRLPLGELVTGYGTEGLGKSALCMRLAAELTRGRLPGEREGQPTNVAIFSAEESPTVTLAPRLMAAEADMERVYLFDGNSELSIPKHLDKIEAALTDMGVSLVVLDPGSAILDPSVDRWHNQQVKAALFPLADMCHRLQLTTLAILHTNRSAGNDARSRAAEALAWRQVSRTTFVFGLDPDHADRRQGERMFAGDKTNLSASDAPSVKVRLESANVDIEGSPQSVVCAVLGDESNYTANQVLAAESEDKQAPARDRAKELIEAELLQAPRTSQHMTAFLDRHGISDKTARRASPDVLRKQHAGQWYWFLPGAAPPWHKPADDEPTEVPGI